MSYGKFLMGELARAKGLINKECEYDLMFETIEAMYKDFSEKSEFNVDTKSEYDCIVDYLDYIKNIPTLPDEPTPTKLEEVADRIVTELNRFGTEENSHEFGLPMYLDNKMIGIVVEQIKTHLKLDDNGIIVTVIR